MGRRWTGLQLVRFKKTRLETVGGPVLRRMAEVLRHFKFLHVKDDVTMSTDAARDTGVLSRFEQLSCAREVIRVEGQALLALSQRLREDFCLAVELVHRCAGNVIVTGMGKAGLVGQKIAATLASTGTISHFLHPGEAVHGDLGRIRRNDILLALSHSGETEEVVRLLPSLRDMNIPVIAITGNPPSRLGQSATVTLDLGPLREACPLGLAPTTSTTAMLAMGDALALVTSRMRRFGAEDFARFHPGGSLGRKLAKVEDVMRPLAECRLAYESRVVREAYIELSRPGRRTGAIMLVDGDGVLTGIFTDSDLARLLEHSRERAIDGPFCDVMTRRPKTIAAGSMMTEAQTILDKHRISELPVVDGDGRPVGLIDITDVLGPAASRDDDSHAEPLRQRVPGGPSTLPFPNQQRR